MVLPNHRGVASSIQGTFKLTDVSTRCCQGVIKVELNVQRPSCVAIQEGCLDICMIDLLAPLSHFVIALEITVRIAIKPGLPANTSPRLSPVLNSRATGRALAIGCSSVPWFCNEPLAFFFNHHEDNYWSVIPSPLPISSCSAAFRPCRPAIGAEIQGPNPRLLLVTIHDTVTVCTFQTTA